MSSSRRTTGEINILAMLDGQAPGRRLRALPAALRYGAAGALACVLLVALAWLIRGGMPARDAAKVGVAQASLPASDGRGSSAATARGGTLDAGIAVTQRDGGIRARDSGGTAVPGMPAALAAEASAADALPPAPASSTSTEAAVTAAPSGAPMGATARGAVIVDMTQPAPATTLPTTPTTAAPAGMAAAHAQPETGRRTETHTAQAAPPTRTQPGARTMPSRARALAHTGPATSRRKRGAAASRATPPSAAVDTDVAVISAILEHTGARHEAADAEGASTCADKSCATRMPTRQ